MDSPDDKSINGTEAAFLFMCCQVGVEGVCKQRMHDRWPEMRFSFSRPGFLTYRLPAGPLPADANLENAFARTYGNCLGRIEATSPVEGADALFAKYADLNAEHIHVWQRDSRPVGEGFEPFATEAAIEAAKAIAARKPPSCSWAVNNIAAAGESIVDCILVEPAQWWIGQHVARSVESRWVGGSPPLRPPENMISRAYLKMHEAIAWSRLPLRRGDWCVELGSAPGGAAQALLEHQLRVLGIDPAEMDPRVDAEEHFHHIRKRVREVPRKDFAKARWLMCDANVTPQQTLDMVEDIVAHKDTHIRGMLLTLKMPNWSLIDNLPEYLRRIRSWGYRYIRPRHLAFNRQEVCVAALRNKSMRRFS